MLIVCACVRVDSVHNVQLSYWKKKRQKKVLGFLVGSSSVVCPPPFPPPFFFYSCHHIEPALLRMESSGSDNIEEWLYVLVNLYFISQYKL